MKIESHSIKWWSCHSTEITAKVSTSQVEAVVSQVTSKKPRGGVPEQVSADNAASWNTPEYHLLNLF